METKPTDPKDIECAIRNILSYIGENPNREGLVGTPDRIYVRTSHDAFLW